MNNQIEEPGSFSPNSSSHSITSFMNQYHSDHDEDEDEETAMSPVQKSAEWLADFLGKHGVSTRERAHGR
jgi:hypothetical protein